MHILGPCGEKLKKTLYWLPFWRRLQGPKNCWLHYPTSQYLAAPIPSIKDVCPMNWRQCLEPGQEMLHWFCPGSLSNRGPFGGPLFAEWIRWQCKHWSTAQQKCGTYRRHGSLDWSSHCWNIQVSWLGGKDNKESEGVGGCCLRAKSKQQQRRILIGSAMSVVWNQKCVGDKGGLWKCFKKFYPYFPKTPINIISSLLFLFQYEGLIGCP